MNLRKSVNTDLIAAIIGFVVMGMFWGSKKDVGHLSIMFPNALLILVGVFSAILLVKSFIRADRGSIFSDGNQLRIICTGSILLAWVVGIMFIGFLLTSLVIFPVLVCYLASARQKISLKKASLWSVISTAEVVLFYLIFSKFLQVPLPTGILI